VKKLVEDQPKAMGRPREIVYYSSDGEVDLERIKLYLRHNMDPNVVLYEWNNIWRPLRSRAHDRKRDKLASDLRQILKPLTPSSAHTKGTLIELWNVCTDYYLPRTELNKSSLTSLISGK
jgi:hypothetical protein